MTPHLASGAGQGIEDAYILATLLAHPLTTRETLKSALKVYDSVRLPYANTIQRLSHQIGRMSTFTDPRFSDLAADNTPQNNGMPNAEYLQKLKDLGDEMMKNWGWAWKKGIEEERKKAVDMLTDMIGTGNTQ